MSENEIKKTAEEYRAEAEKYRKQLKEYNRTFVKTGAIMAAVLAVIFIASVAWFASNTGVAGGGGSVITELETIKIASKGSRQEPEQKYFNLDPGKKLTYNGEDYYYTDSGEIALYLGENYELKPGSYGEIEFFIIPQNDGASSVTVFIEFAGYKNKDNEEDKVVKVDDEILDALLNGHLLLFGKNENGIYSNWLNNSVSQQNTITVAMDETARTDVPYPCKLYWIWPKMYSNLKDISVLSQFIEEQAGVENSDTYKPINSSGYYYSELFISGSFPINGSEMRSRAYNLADEYIGLNMDYLYITIRTSPSE